MPATPDNFPGNYSFEKLKELDAHFNEQLKKHQKPTGTDVRTGYRLSAKKIAGIALGLLFLLMLPFLVLIRSAVFLYQSYAVNGWLALTFGMGMTVLVLLIYAAIINYRISNSTRVHKYVRRAVVLLVIAYCGYGLLYFSNVNAKDPEIASYYRSLHPILRLTVATTILWDNDLIVTDMQRTPDDYHTMGLPVRKQSLHYRQSSGYVHAVDIRTRGRSVWKNWLTNNIFALLGMKTLRHVGTADHLHVYLPVSKQ